MKPTILIDVDETVVLTIQDWKDWYKKETGNNLDLSKQISIENSLIKHDIDPLDYWRNPKLYDTKIPITEAGKFIQKYRYDYNIVFCSHCFVEHKISKQKFIKRWFGDFPFVDTESKEYVKCDYAIDDRAYFLRNIKKLQPNAVCIQIKSIENNHNEFYYKDWDEIDQFFENIKLLGNKKY
jgi:hypothetical protein